MNNFQAMYHEASKAGAAAAGEIEQQLIRVKDMSGRVFGPFPICGFGWVNVLSL